MNIEDCEVGMKVECKINAYSLVAKNKIYTIKEINKRIGKIALNEPCTNLCTFNPNHFKPANKFKVGDEVLFKEYGKQYKAEIFGLTTDKAGEVASIRFESDNEYHFRIILDIDFYLSPLKKKDELEVGDKFRQKGKAEHKIVGVHYDEEEDSKIYVVRLLDGEIKGAIDLVFPKTIREIIYD